MSRVSQRVVSTLQVVESQIRRTIYSYDGNQPLPDKDQKFMADLYTVMACIWYDASLQPALVSKRWVYELVKPVSLIMSALKDVDYWLISQEHRSYDDFKHHLRTSYPGFGQFFSPLAGNISRFYSTGEGLPELRTALRFATRANLPDPVGLVDEAFEAWQNTALQEWDWVDMQQESRSLKEIFPRRAGFQQLDNFIGRFGPGVSYDCKDSSRLEKYLSFKTDNLLNYLGQHVDFSPYEVPTCREGLERIHAIHFVPKQLDKLRTVSMEPPSLMFYQLGVQRAMISMINRSRWRYHINFERADLNQDLAWLGSIDGSFATIDMSSASDTVRYRMVRSLFDGTCLREALVLSRSRLALYEGELYMPTYFAPMGSGCCFPVETCVFASVVDSVMQSHGDRRAWRVYGDDIVVPGNRFDEVVSRLTQLGFVINLDKSFYGDHGGFRESCGGDFFYGENVRPVYVSRFWGGLCHGHRCPPSLIESNIDLANRLIRYPQARLRVIESLLALKPVPLFDVDGESGLFSTTPTNYRSKSRYNEDYQRNEYWTGITKVRSEKDKLEHEGIRYFETLRAMAERPLCKERLPISVSRTLLPIWSGAWRTVSPGWREGASVLSKEKGRV